MFSKKDFEILNISNLPSTKDQLVTLLDIFYNNEYSLKDVVELESSKRLNLTNETFRKMINHSQILGILKKTGNRYTLSSHSKIFYESGFGIDEYIFHLVKSNTILYRQCSIILLLLQVFPPSIRHKTLYTIFSYIGKRRTDASAISSVGRNLRAVFSLLRFMGVAEKKDDELILKNRNLDKFIYYNVKSVEDYYSSDIISVDKVTKYINTYFDKKISLNILSCLATYEVKNYIWSKSSLFKNQGEVENLFGEYIMTVMSKKER